MRVITVQAKMTFNNSINNNNLLFQTIYSVPLSWWNILLLITYYRANNMDLDQIDPLTLQHSN